MCGHTETGMWRHCLRPKKVAFRTFRVRKSTSNVLLYMQDLQMCAYSPDSRHVPHFIIHCQRLKLNVDFRGKSVRWSQTPSPLAYAVYAFTNVDSCERPLKCSRRSRIFRKRRPLSCEVPSRRDSVCIDLSNESPINRSTMCRS